MKQGAIIRIYIDDEGEIVQYTVFTDNKRTMKQDEVIPALIRHVQERAGNE